MKLNSNDIVLFSGDSITDGNRGRSMDCNHIMGHGYQYIVSAKLAVENSSAMPKFYNKGYSGARMCDLLAKWQEDVIDLNPTIISVLAGTNDANSGFHNGLTPEASARNYKTNLTEALKVTCEYIPDIKIVVCQPFYFPTYDKTTSFDFAPHPYCEENHGRPDKDETKEQIEYRLTAMDLIYKYTEQVADEYADVYVPLYDRLSTEIAKSRTEYFMWDGTHPTIAGHEIIAQEWLKATEKL